MRRRTMGLILGVAAIVSIPVAVMALTNGRSSRLDRQTNAVANKVVFTSSANWRNVPGLTDVRICPIGQVTAMLSVNVSGAPVAFRVLYDDGPTLFPGKAAFDPAGSGARGFAFDFVGPAFTTEARDGHVYTVQWRTLGGKVTLHGRVLDLLYQNGTHC